VTEPSQSQHFDLTPVAGSGKGPFLSTRDQKYSRISALVGLRFTATLWQQSFKSERPIGYGLPRAPGDCGVLECGGARPRVCHMTVQPPRADQERSARAAKPIWENLLQTFDPNQKLCWMNWFGDEVKFVPLFASCSEQIDRSSLPREEQYPTSGLHFFDPDCQVNFRTDRASSRPISEDRCLPVQPSPVL
jgi:hypothetical protein